MELTLARADLHVHVSADRAAKVEPPTLVTSLAASPLSVVAITEHDHLDVARSLAARRIAGPEIVVGAEISTRDGHLLGLWLQELPPAGMTMADTIAAVHDQGGITIVSHPLLPTAISASGRLLADLADLDARHRPDGLEVFNPMAAWLPGHTARVRRFAVAHGYAAVGGSDAHKPTDIGRASTHFRGAGAADLRAAILAGTTSGDGRAYGPRDASAGVLAQLRAKTTSRSGAGSRRP